MKIDVWTDGSSLDNGKPHCVGGWSAVFMMGNKKYIRYGHLPAPSSNNRGEIFGVLYTMMMFKDKKDWNIQIRSDSQYVVKAINEWRHKWKLSKYEGIKNPDLLIPLFNAWDAHGNATINWVKGHAGTYGNELADEYAGLGSKKITREISNDAYDIKMIQQQRF
jgi:ribonuclease HI